MIKILDNTYKRLGVIKNAIDSTRLESINGENTLDFKAVLDSKLSTLIDENSMYEIDDDYFDTATFMKTSNEDDTYTVQAETEHISYRLNLPKYNIDYFAEEGTPTAILGKILEGTEFTVGTVEYTTNIVYYAQEAKSRRQILMDFTDQLGGELIFSKLEISIVTHRGSTAVKPVLKDRNIRILSKSVNKRSLDDNGNPTVSYECTPIYMPGDAYTLGDDVLLINKELKINEKLRVVKISTNPYDEAYTIIEFSNSSEGIATSLYQIANSSVLKDKTYNGIKIGPEYGFEAIRNDKKARAYFKSDGMAFQSGDGTGENWKDRLYYEYDSEKDETRLVFDGAFSTDSIEAIKANIDVVVSNTVITQTLYAQKGIIAELTVDELNTSNKVERYFNIDTSTIRYIKIHNKIIDGETKSVIEFITGITDGSTEQVTDRHGLPVFWVDAEYSGITMDVTEWPVIVYKYTETITSTINSDQDADEADISNVNVSDDNLTITRTDGSKINYSLTKDAQGRTTSVGGIIISYDTSTDVPTLISAETTTDGKKIILTFSDTMADPSGMHSQFTINTPVVDTVISAGIGTDNRQIILTLTSDVVSGNIITVGYNKGTITSASGVSLESFTNQSVTNKVATINNKQKWSSYPESPITTATYPYQCITHLIDDHKDYLVCSAYKLYDDYTDIYVTNIRREIVIYIYDMGEWVIYNSQGIRQKFTTFIEANTDIYTDQNYTTVRFAKTTS